MKFTKFKTSKFYFSSRYRDIEAQLPSYLLIDKLYCYAGITMYITLITIEMHAATMGAGYRLFRLLDHAYTAMPPLYM